MPEKALGLRISLKFKHRKQDVFHVGFIFVFGRARHEFISEFAFILLTQTKIQHILPVFIFFVISYVKQDPPRKSPTSSKTDTFAFSSNVFKYLINSFTVVILNLLYSLFSVSQTISSICCCSNNRIKNFITIFFIFNITRIQLLCLLDTYLWFPYLLIILN